MIRDRKETVAVGVGPDVAQKLVVRVAWVHGGQERFHGMKVPPFGSGKRKGTLWFFRFDGEARTRRAKRDGGMGGSGVRSM